MPKSLLERGLPDSIRQFRLAAEQRFRDGFAAAISDRRTAAIYLWGYAAEMTIKAAYFAATGFEEERPITRDDLNDAFKAGRAAVPEWPRAGSLHHIPSWAKWLVLTRATSPSLAYPRPDFGLEVQERGDILGEYWRETLRYRKNVAYLYELRRVRDAKTWLLTNAAAL